MKVCPEFNPAGDLPAGLHAAHLGDVLARFGTGTYQREVVARRLERIHRLARSTHQVARFVVFGSFVTAKPAPNDVDIFIVMQDSFDVSKVTGEARLVFDHATAQSALGASVFWIRRAAALGGEEAAVRHWQIKRDGEQRGIVEVETYD